MEVKFVKGKKAPVAVTLRPIGITAYERALGVREPEVVKQSKGSLNPWIDRRHFNTMMARCVQAEEMCKRLIAVIAVDDGEFLASHDYDYLAAGHAILKGDV